MSTATASLQLLHVSRTFCLSKKIRTSRAIKRSSWTCKDAHTGLLCLLLLYRAKGGLINICWARNIRHATCMSLFVCLDAAKQARSQQVHCVVLTGYSIFFFFLSLKENKVSPDFMSLGDKTEQRFVVLSYEGIQFLHCRILKQHSLWICLSLMYTMFITQTQRSHTTHGQYTFYTMDLLRQLWVEPRKCDSTTTRTFTDLFYHL